MQTLNLNDVFTEHVPQLRSFAYRFTKDAGETDDLIQETLLKAFRYSDLFKPGTNMGAWLCTIMRNTFINDYRRSVRKNAIITQEEEISYAHLIKSASKNNAEGKFAMADIQRTLSKLPKVYYEPFIQYFEGYKYHEIADALNIPIGTVKTRIHMERQILQRQLKVYRK
jgi:RNA polymerase sigma factor (sigma-70 family)